MRNRFARYVALVTVLAVAVSVGLVSGGNASPSSTASERSAVTASKGVVAQNGKGKIRSRVVGTTANDRRVTGTFYPLEFAKKNGTVKVRGLLQGVVHNANGSTSTFTALRTMKVKSINGEPATARSAGQNRATCDVLHLVLAPLDLDLLGLQVHLDRVVLDIVAVSGAGNLLGNLLCAVTGLVDGGLAGQLGRLVRLLDRVLDILRSGV
jgi:hypothetical protein